MASEIVISYPSAAITATERTGFMAMPLNRRMPAVYKLDPPFAKKGIAMRSLKYPSKQIHASDNYVVQEGVSLPVYNARSVRTRMNPYPSHLVPINANVMRIVGRTSSNDGTMRGPPPNEGPNPEGDLPRDPSLVNSRENQIFVQLMSGETPVQTAKQRPDGAINGPSHAGKKRTGAGMGQQGSGI